MTHLRPARVGDGVQAIWCAVLLVATLTVAWLAYVPGLAGGFVFDDLGSLPALGDFGPVDNWKTFLYYLTSGTADPFGRPVAMLTFLIDANDWPADPEPFKRTNILMHLLNGVLLSWLLLRLGQLTPLSASRTRLAAVLGAGFWLLHPLWASTTLYVVQREAMLAATFVLIGLIAYLHGRRMIATHPLSGSLWIVAGVGGCTLLGVLAKANAILLPIYVTVLEWVYIRSLPERLQPARTLSRSLLIGIYPLVVAITSYLIYAGLLGVPSYRPWTLGQRLLTEPGVLLDYLKLLILPRPYSHGLFNDNFAAAQDLFHPWTTLPALLAVMALLTFSFAARKRWRAVALAIAFFFAGHLLESTTLPLELYFEHRNYLPAMLLFWPIGLWLCSDGALARAKPLLAAGALVLLFAETHAAASLWGDPKTQALVWAAQNPESPRAQSYAASAERAMGRLTQAEIRLRSAIAVRPDEIQLQINLLGTLCDRGTLGESDIAAAEHALRTAIIRGPIAFDWISTGIEHVRAGTCMGLSLGWLQRLIDAARKNSHAKDLPHFQQIMDNFDGQIALARGDSATAEHKFLAALDADPRPDIALKQAAIFGSNGLPQAGLRQLDRYEVSALGYDRDVPITNMQALHAWLLGRNGYWENELAHMRRVLTEDVQKLAPSEKHDS